jgi:hypothetical protein
MLVQELLDFGISRAKRLRWSRYENIFAGPAIDVIAN